MSGKEEINCYENRELSWLRFNERVLEEARNTLRRVEVATPVYDEKLKLRIRGMFVTMFSDNVKDRVQQPDGSYVIPAEADTRLESQEYFYEQAYDRICSRVFVFMINNMKNEHNYVEACKNDYLRLNDRM